MPPSQPPPVLATRAARLLCARSGGAGSPAALAFSASGLSRTWSRTALVGSPPRPFLYRLVALGSCPTAGCPIRWALPAESAPLSLRPSLPKGHSLCRRRSSQRRGSSLTSERRRGNDWSLTCSRPPSASTEGSLPARRTARPSLPSCWTSPLSARMLSLRGASVAGGRSCTQMHLTSSAYRAQVALSWSSRASARRSTRPVAPFRTSSSGGRRACWPASRAPSRRMRWCSGCSRTTPWFRRPRLTSRSRVWASSHGAPSASTCPTAHASSSRVR
mmetsp:Transcript_7420/g.18742  ORF Transcript_7420/g.18742 Transcript_7420/m.18742 type:complete len:275 (-) Transcript_7420:416-1240(-)